MKKDIRFLLTNSCNYDCYFCHNEGVEAKRTRNELSVEHYVTLFKVYSKMEEWNGVTLSGGEPLLYRYIDTLCQRLHEEGAKITIVTNGSLLSNHLPMLKYVDRINVSIHTLTDSVYEHITGRKNMLSHVKETLKLVRSLYPNLQVRLNVKPCKSNGWSMEELNMILSFSKQLNSSVKMTELFPKSDPNCISINSLREQLSENGYIFVETEDRTELFVKDGHNVYLTQCTCSKACETENAVAYCRATHDLYVNHNGKFLLCRLGSEAMDFWDEIDSNDLENLKAKIKVAKLRVSKQCCYGHLKEYH